MKKRVFTFLAFLALLLSADIVSKSLAISSIPMMTSADRFYPFGGIGIMPDWFGITFSLNYVTNTGAAWGFFGGFPGLLFGLRTAIIAALIWYLFKSKSKFPLWLIAAGAIGNAIDYCLYGHVIDFLHFTFWGYSFPIFNIADSCITIGVLSLLLFSRRGKKQIQAL